MKLNKSKARSNHCETPLNINLTFKFSSLTLNHLLRYSLVKL